MVSGPYHLFRPIFRVFCVWVSFRVFVSFFILSSPFFIVSVILNICEIGVLDFSGKLFCVRREKYLKNTFVKTDLDLILVIWSNIYVIDAKRVSST